MTSAVLSCFYAGGALRMIAFAVADACPDATGERMYRSVPTLAHMAQVSERTVQRALQKFVADGWLLPMDDGRGGRGRSAMYRISPSWITEVALEVAHARVYGALPRPVPPNKNDAVTQATPQPAPQPVDNSIKGDKLSPFPKPERVTNPHLKGDKLALKGDTAMSPEHYEQNTTNTPLIPQTGETPQLPEFKNPLAAGFEAFKAHYPRKRWSEEKTWVVWQALAPDAAMQECIMRELADQAGNPDWQAHYAQFVTRSDRWLKAKPWVGEGDAAPPPPKVVPPLPPPVVLTPEQLAANKARAVAARARLGLRERGEALRGVIGKTHARVPVLLPVDAMMEEIRARSAERSLASLAEAVGSSTPLAPVACSLG